MVKLKEVSPALQNFSTLTAATKKGYKEKQQRPLVLVAQLGPTLCDPVDCSPPGCSIHGILQARILEWVAIPFSRGSSRPRVRTWVSCLAGRFFTIWTTREGLAQAIDIIKVLGRSSSLLAWKGRRASGGSPVVPVSWANLVPPLECGSLPVCPGGCGSLSLCVLQGGKSGLPSDSPPPSHQCLSLLPVFLPLELHRGGSNAPFCLLVPPAQDQASGCSVFRQNWVGEERSENCRSRGRVSVWEVAWRWVDRCGLGKMDRLKETKVTSLASVWL